MAVLLAEAGLSEPTPLAYASFGTIRLLAVLALLHDPNPPLLTCVEELDHGLHPYAFDRIVERMRIASRRTQFLIATHSPALVNRLDPSELIVCERDDAGAYRIPAIDAETASDAAPLERARNYPEGKRCTTFRDVDEILPAKIGFWSQKTVLSQIL